jgi:hypothetical protein
MLFVMADRFSTIERAYQLARSGEFANVGKIKIRLRAEGYAGINGQLFGAVITTALRRLCTESRAKSEIGVRNGSASADRA